MYRLISVGCQWKFSGPRCEECRSYDCDPRFHFDCKGLTGHSSVRRQGLSVGDSTCVSFHFVAWWCVGMSLEEKTSKTEPECGFWFARSRRSDVVVRERDGVTERGIASSRGGDTLAASNIAKLPL